MKIARIETHVCHARMRNWVFVKVVTDQDGLFGWGEATLEWHTRAVVGAVMVKCLAAGRAAVAHLQIAAEHLGFAAGGAAAAP